MKRVQDEKSVTRTEKVQPKKCATRKKSNMKRVQHAKTSTWKNAKRKEGSTKKEQHKKSST